MNQIKAYFFDRFNTFSLLLLTTITALTLLMLRIKLTHSYFLLFMVWNLFLAFIPFGISALMRFRSEKIGKWKMVLWTGIWLVFLPNAPYMLTDLIHLLNNKSIPWLDAVVILCFALDGLILYYISVRDMKKELKLHFPQFWLENFFSLLPLLIAIGIYVGRFLRWNSWDIITDPKGIFVAISELFVNPVHNRLAWLFIFLFSGLLLSGSLLLQKYRILQKLD